MSGECASTDVAWKYVDSGNFGRAEQICRQILRADATNLQAHFILGTIANQACRHKTAEEAFQTCVRLDPNYAQAWNNLGNAQAGQGMASAAVESYRRALALTPNYAEALNNLGNALRRIGHIDDAIASYRQALSINNDYAEAHNNLGNALRQLGMFDQAKASLRRAIDLRPTYAEAFNNLGIASAAQGDWNQAISAFERAIQLRPEFPDAVGNLGVALLDSGAAQAAVEKLLQALSQNPNLAGLHCTLGRAYTALGEHRKAIRSFRNATALRSDFVDAWFRRGDALQQTGDQQAAADCFERAISIQPSHEMAWRCWGIALARTGNLVAAAEKLTEATKLKPDFAAAHFELGRVLMALGDFCNGWRECARADHLELERSGVLDAPLWTGQSLAGKTIAVRCPDDAGESIQLFRYILELRNHCATVICVAPRSFGRWLRACFPDIDVVDDGVRSPACDFVVGLRSLPHLLREFVAQIPQMAPYVNLRNRSSDDGARQRSASDALRIGVSWRCQRRDGGDAERSVPLAHFGLLARLRGVRMFCLQDPATEFSSDTVQKRLPIHWIAGLNADAEGDDLLSEFDRLQSLDLVITVDNATAHLSAAAGIPTWLLAPHMADWRWGQSECDSPWYPTLRIFRQPAPRDWDTVFERVGAALAQWLASDDAQSLLPAGREASEPHSDLGFAFAKSGRNAEAVVAFRQAVRIAPDESETRRNLADALRRAGLVEAALPHYARAIELAPDDVDAYNNMGIALAMIDRRADAIAHFRKAISLRADHLQALGNLGTAYFEAGQLDEATKHLSAAIAHDPSFTKARITLAKIHSHKLHYRECIEQLNEVVRIEPNHVESRLLLANALREIDDCAAAVAEYEAVLQIQPESLDALNNLGITHSRMERFKEAVASYREALRIDPEFADALNNVGIALARLGQLDEAAESYRKALALRPNYAEAYSNLGITFAELERHDEAVECYEHALRLKPRYAAAHSNLGIALNELGRSAEALWNYDQALEIEPNYPDAHMNRALCLLAMGDFESGWRQYEWRWKCKGMSIPPYKQPLWDGSALNGKTIVLHYEQGLGDTLQFVRYASLVAERGGRVILLCQESLIPLLERCPGVDQLLPKHKCMPPCDTHLPLLSLPHVFGTTLDTVPQTVPYVWADPALVDHWRIKMRKHSGLRVGINWQGNPRYRGDRHRSIPLVHFAPLAQIDDVHLFSLQKNYGLEQLREMNDSFSVVNLGPLLDVDKGAFMDTAAVMMNLDLMITSDTAIAHVAGSLGIPVWLALPKAADWRGMIDTDSCPWYPNMRLFRQREFGHWSEVFERIAAELRAMAERRSAIGDAPSMIGPGETLSILAEHEVALTRGRYFGSVAQHRRVRQLHEQLKPSLDRSPRLRQTYEQMKMLHSHLYDLIGGEFGAADSMTNGDPTLYRAHWDLHRELERLKATAEELAGRAHEWQQPA